VLAQQGSQMLSAFGAGGAIAGGVVALGAGFMSMRSDAIKAFEDITGKADQFKTALNKNLAGADLGGIVSQLDAAAKFFDESKKQYESTSRGVVNTLVELTGGPKVQEMQLALLNQTVDAKKALEAVEGHLAAAAMQQLEIDALRIKGEKDKADEMQRQLNLARELAKIQGMDVSASTKGILSTAAIARSEAGKPVVPTGPNLLGRVTGFFGAAMTQMAPTIDAISNRLKERAQQSLSRTQAFAGALGGLRGDMDTSTGRSAFNPLRADGSKQLSEMARQTAALRRVAQTGDKQTSLLQSIDATIRRLNLIPKYS